jgi:hypothetical protein
MRIAKSKRIQKWANEIYAKPAFKLPSKLY